jgi:hypothetical protein
MLCCAPQQIIRAKCRNGSFSTFSMTWPDVGYSPDSDWKSRHGRAPRAEQPRRPPCPRCLDFHLLRYRQSVVNIDAQISHRALNLRVSKQKLNCTQIACAAVDQCGLCPPQRVRAVDMWVESNPDQPVRYKARILPS